jgi:outer membrane receptor protein involved in Fe transport
MTRRLLGILGSVILAASTAVAQDPPPAPAQESTTEEEQVKREEVVVVTASKIESTLTNAPATMTVVTSETLASAPSQNFGDILRNVPGTNVIQMSARDVNITSRQATSTLATSQLVLLDGRSIYLDFFGLVLWDMVPNNPNDIKQIEVVRGPASAVWGANALTGVVNIITKTPREAAGGSFALSGGLFDRECENCSQDDGGSSYGTSLSYAGAPNDTWSYRIAGGYFNSDPYSRPTGQIPVVPDPRIDNPTCQVVTVPAPPGLPVPPGTPIQSGVGANCVGGGFYPTDGTGAPGTAFENSGTSQPKVDLRVDQDFTSGGRMSYSAGYAGTEGIVHTGIGPFDLQSGSFMGYGRVGYSKGALKVAAFANFLDAEAPNLLLTDPATLQPVQLNFKTQTFDLEAGNANVIGGKHILSYGGNVRRNNFDITLASTAEDRTELGAYFQWEYFADKFRVVAGGRVDKFGNIDDPVFSPRVSLMFKPSQDHTLRASYNRAFRSPSAINNFLDQRIFAPGVAPIDLRPLIPLLSVVAPPLVPLVPAQPIRLTVRNVGNEIGSTSGTTELKEESLDAYELSYTGTFGGRTTLGLAVYQNDSNDNINFTNVIPSATFPTGIVPPFDVYTPANSSEIGIPGPLYAFILQARIPRFPLPRTVTTYLNLGPLRQRGVEVSLDHRINDTFTASANYSFQDDPEILDADSGQIAYPVEELALPAKNRFNASLSWNAERFVGVASVNYSDEAFWSDVLSAPFHGFTDSYTMVNATFGVKWGAEGRLVTSLKGINLFNEAIQQHVFGDIMKRTLSFELRYNF